MKDYKIKCYVCKKYMSVRLVRKAFDNETDVYVCRECTKQKQKERRK